ncbi:hypothetical protein [Rothia nasimurium]|uniref:hypothetical protein n=1 Tax=Rothia nasimurium TaxID=85336 RepID=UPI003BA12B7C
MNPARTLYKLFRRWNIKRNLNWLFESGNIEIGTEELNQAARCFQEIEYYFALMENQGRNVNKYREKVPGYFKAFAASTTGQPIMPRDFETLEYLADVFDSLTGDALAVQKHLDQHKDDLRDQLANLIQNFLDDETLDQTLKNHAVMLCKHIQENIDNAEAAGYFDFTESVRLLRIYVDAAAERSTDGTFKQAFRKFNEEFLKHPLAPYVVTGVAVFFGMKELGQ